MSYLSFCTRSEHCANCRLELPAKPPRKLGPADQMAPDRSERKVDHRQRRLLDRRARRSSEEPTREVGERGLEGAIQIPECTGQSLRMRVADEVLASKRDQQPSVGGILPDEVVNRQRCAECRFLGLGVPQRGQKGRLRPF